MSGMDMMLARMLGMTPEEMKTKANEMTQAVVEAADLMKEIRTRLIDIQDKLERMENERSTGSGSEHRDTSGGNSGSDLVQL